MSSGSVKMLRPNTLQQMPIPQDDIGSRPFNSIKGRNDPQNTDAIFAVIENKRINRRERFEALVNCVNAGVDVNMKNDSGETPLICCVKKRFLVGSRFLLEAGCDVNIRDEIGHTALHYCLIGSVEANIVMVKMLLESGANPNIKDCSGRSPMHLALVCGNKDVFQTMVSHNGNLSDLKPENCADLILRFGFRLNFDSGVMMQRLYLIGYPLSECYRIIQHLKLLDIDFISASAFLDTITDSVPPLTELSRSKVRKCLRKSGQVSDLVLPPSLQRFVRMENLDIKATEVVKVSSVLDQVPEIPMHIR